LVARLGSGLKRKKGRIKRKKREFICRRCPINVGKYPANNIVVQWSGCGPLAMAHGASKKSRLMWEGTSFLNTNFFFSDKKAATPIRPNGYKHYSLNATHWRPNFFSNENLDVDCNLSARESNPE